MEGYVKGAVRKDLHIAPFVEPFNTLLWESFTDKFCQNLEQFT